MYVLVENLSRKQAETCALVLASAGLSHRILPDGKRGFNVWVKEAHYDQALDAVTRYYQENRTLPRPMAVQETPGFNAGGFMGGILACLLLMACQYGTDVLGEARGIVDRFGASAAAIMDGEVYRAVTALMLHSDVAHMVGNMAGLMVFGAGVCILTGWGVGWFMILCTGAAGNWVNAWMWESAHVSIGASTAVFGAVGILTGHQMAARGKITGRRGSVWAALACGLALLGFLGSEGERTDLMAHLFGFGCGLLAGAAHAIVRSRPFVPMLQWMAAATALSVITLSWMIGWRHAL